MENYIILGIVLLLALAAVAVLIKRRGRKGCCGSGSLCAPKEKDQKRGGRQGLSGGGDAL